MTGYIPKYIRYSEFPESGLYGIHKLKALDMAMAGEIDAYHRINADVKIIGDSLIQNGVVCSDYGTFWGVRARLFDGHIDELSEYKTVTVPRTQFIHVAGFEGFGMEAIDERSKPRFIAERQFWLSLVKDESFTFHLGGLTFLRDQLASKAERPTTPARPSHLKIIAALLNLLAEPRRTGHNQSAVIAEILERHPDTRGLSKRNLEEVFAAANRAASENE